jgi:hypothetical protein
MRERTEGEELYNCFGGDKWEKVIYCILRMKSMSLLLIVLFYARLLTMVDCWVHLPPTLACPREWGCLTAKSNRPKKDDNISVPSSPLTIGGRPHATLFPQIFSHAPR